MLCHRLDIIIGALKERKRKRRRVAFNGFADSELAALPTTEGECG